MIEGPQHLQFGKQALRVFDSLLSNYFDSSLLLVGLVGAAEDAAVSSLAQFRMETVFGVDIFFYHANKAVAMKF